jgi:phosphatidylserine decarboxylase
MKDDFQTYNRRVHVIETDEPMYVKERSVRISIFLSVFDVHVNRYPVDGTIELVHYNKGKFLHAADEKASLDNEQSSIGMSGPRGRVLVRQIAGLIARRIVTDSKVGDQAAQGARLGLIRFGSRTDVFLPLSARPVVKVKPGDRVRVGGTVLAEYS